MAPSIDPSSLDVFEEIALSQTRVLRRLTRAGALVSVVAVVAAFACFVLRVKAAAVPFGVSAVLSAWFVRWYLRPPSFRLWAVFVPADGTFSSAALDGPGLALHPSLDRALRRKPEQIVWAYAHRRGLASLVCVALSSGVRHAIPLDASGCERVLRAVARLAPGAEIGFSDEREALYLRDPQGAPHLETRRQIVNSVCPACSAKIVTESGATLCTQCGSPVHEGCLGLHLQGAHAKAHAYR